MTFIRKASAHEIDAASRKVTELVPSAKLLPADMAHRFAIQWLANFAPDMTLRDAKAFCLPRRLRRNYLANAIEMQYVSSLDGDEKEAVLSEGFSGNCYLFLNDINVLFSVENGADITSDVLSKLDYPIATDKKLTLTVLCTPENVYAKKIGGDDENED